MVILFTQIVFVFVSEVRALSPTATCISRLHHMWEGAADQVVGTSAGRCSP